MGLRFRKTIKRFPSARINLNKSGVSTPLSPFPALALDTSILANQSTGLPPGCRGWLTIARLLAVPHNVLF